ncbi:hypothetical protein [Sporosarcina sp. E16_8]|uniref:hypothetical protein n=1 Tax=Sporosarcina sp. E16_8 TaxID=2789295 RepID=UPI001A928B72|nr:hypothetical protein [Sporosarcina sp. E16_8]MBO0589741.1 hypothetical protein [Sporosarcina sp. E16_8]
MKKLLGTLFVGLLLVGCNTDNDQKSKTGEEENVGKEIEQQALSMQVLKVDEENGVTVEDGIYKELTGLLEANPTIGVANDFSIHALDLEKTKEGRSVILFLGINRLEKGIKDITLEYTLGVETEGTVEYVFNREEIILPARYAGVIQPNHAIPFTLPLTPKGEELLEIMTKENKVMSIDNATYELEK